MIYPAALLAPALAAVTIDGWTVDFGRSGSLDWSRHGSPYIVSVTPGWEGDPGVPVQIMDDEGRIVFGLDLDTPAETLTTEAYLAIVAPLLAWADAVQSVGAFRVS